MVPDAKPLHDARTARIEDVGQMAMHGDARRELTAGRQHLLPLESVASDAED